MRNRPPRYIVGIPSERICYQGKSKIKAWLTWLQYRKSGAVAFDCASWVSNPSYWLIGEAPAANFFNVPAQVIVSKPVMGSLDWLGLGVDAPPKDFFFVLSPMQHSALLQLPHAQRLVITRHMVALYRSRWTDLDAKQKVIALADHGLESGHLIKSLHKELHRYAVDKHAPVLPYQGLADVTFSYSDAIGFPAGETTYPGVSLSVMESDESFQFRICLESPLNALDRPGLYYVSVKLPGNKAIMGRITNTVMTSFILQQENFVEDNKKRSSEHYCIAPAINESGYYLTRGTPLSRYVKDFDSSLQNKGDFKKWRWFQLEAPAHKQDGLRWTLRRFLLRRFIKSGGVLVIVGKARSGKTLLLERLMPGNIIENVRRNGFQRNARIEASDIPTGLFAIDETSYHDRDDVIRVLEETAKNNRGLALVFQWHDIFRRYDLAACLAKRKVLFLEFF